MATPKRRIAGIAASIPAGYVLGRTQGGEGDVGLISISELGQSMVASGAVPIPVTAPVTVAAGTGISVSGGPAYTITNAGVTSAVAGTGISVSGGIGAVTFSLASIADLRLLANISGGAASPSANTLTAIFDAIFGSGQGKIVYRSSGSWTTLAVASNVDTREAQIKALVQDGTGQDPKWSAVGHYVWKRTVSAATTAALPACTYNNGTAGVGATLTGNSNGAITAQDGVTLDATVNNSLLVKDQANQIQNGVYWVTQVGTGGTPFILTRMEDLNDYTSGGTGMFFPVASGTTQGQSVWMSAISQTTFGSDNILFAKVAGAGAAAPISSAALDAQFGSTQGQILYRSASAWTVLSPSTAGFVLTTGGTGANPSWAQNQITVTNNPYFTLSNSNLTATQNTSPSTNRSIISSTFHSSGKYYFEFVASVYSNNEELYGLATSALAITGAMGINTGSLGFGQNNNGTAGGFIFYNNVFNNDLWSSSNKTTPNIANNDVIGIAVDFTNKKVWARQNAGAWNARSAGTQDPATNQGGFTATTLLGNLCAPGFTSFDGASSGAAILRTATSQFTQTAPSGFSPWDDGTQSPAVATTWGTSASAVGTMATQNSNAVSITGGSIEVPTLKIDGATSGVITLAVPAVAGTNTWTFPAGTTDFSATGGANKVVKQTSSGGALTVAVIAAADLPTDSIWIGRQVITATGTYTATSGATRCDVTLVGGGAGGGGVGATTAVQNALAESGAAGGAARKRVTAASITGTTCTIGAGGAGATAGVNNGTAGGQSTFAGMTCNGGTAGNGGGASPAGGAVGSKAGGTASGGDINIAGGDGFGAVQTFIGDVASGPGGTTPFGLGFGGGPAVTGGGGTAGRAGTGYGSGGSGAAGTNGAAAAGGAGQPGICIIDEYR